MKLQQQKYLRKISKALGAVALYGIILPLAEAQSGQHWQKLGQDALARAQAQFDDGRRARNLILFVGDGMGISTVTAARILAGQQQGKPGEENLLSFEHFPFTGLVKTYNVNQQTPDSAGTMTALVTGIKTKAGMLSVDARSIRQNCASAKNRGLVTLLEQAEEKGMATGLVSTARITHATPAATYAHLPERNWESDADMSAKAQAEGCRDIARQLIEFEHGDGIEVVLGGGRARFLPKTAPDPEYPAKSGHRQDGRNLIKEWLNRHDKAAYVWSLAQFESVQDNRIDRLLGLFEPSHMQFEADRANDQAKEPSLRQMTEKAIRILERHPGGYFLMVEGGRIDHGHHATNAYRALTDTIAFAEAVAAAVQMSKDDTLIVVTADHSHTLTIGGYPARGNPILGKVAGVDKDGEPEEEFALDAKGQPYTTLAYANGPGAFVADQSQGAQAFRGFLPELMRQKLKPAAQADTEDINYLQIGAVAMATETHGGEDVAVYAQGPGAAWFHGVMEQNVVYWLMQGALEAFEEE